MHNLFTCSRSYLDIDNTIIISFLICSFRLTEFPKPRWDDDDELHGSLSFNFTDFLRRCQLPEFRCLFRAYELYPWSKVSEFEDVMYGCNTAC
jgi:hypothetical protein